MQVLRLAGSSRVGTNWRVRFQNGTHPELEPDVFIRESTETKKYAAEATLQSQYQ